MVVFDTCGSRDTGPGGKVFIASYIEGTFKGVAAGDGRNRNVRVGSGSGNVTGCIFEYMGKGEVVYSIIHVSAHASVHIVTYIDFT